MIWVSAATFIPRRKQIYLLGFIEPEAVQKQNPAFPMLRMNAV